MLNKKNIKRILLVAFVLETLVLVCAGQAAAGDISIVKPANDSVAPESRDFAVERFADPWDMSRYSDLSFGQYTSGLTDMKWKAGMFSARSTGYATTHPLFAGIDGVVVNGRDGYLNRIDTSRYNRISLRMYSSRKAAGQFFWFYNQQWNDFGSIAFVVEPGWHTYIIDPTSSGLWIGKPMGLRLDPVNASGIDFKIDWIRLFQQTSRRIELGWTDRQPGQETNIYLDLDQNPDNDNAELLGSQIGGAYNSFKWDPSPYEPRNYYLYAKKAGQAGVYSRRVTINRAPLTRIQDPDEQGGRDYATTEIGDPWDMSQPGDVWYWLNMTNVDFSQGVMSGSPINGDSHFHLRVPKSINTDIYHRLSFRFSYDGPFDYGGGTMTRTIWSADHNQLGLYQTLDDIPTYPTWETYTVDLKKTHVDVGTVGWNGLVNDFRFNPAEGDHPARFHVDFIQIRADDEANQKFTIKWSDGKKSPRPTRVALYYDTNKKGFNGRLIVKNRLQAKGMNSYVWKTSGIPARKYFIYAVTRDGVNETKTYSSGPIAIRH